MANEKKNATIGEENVEKVNAAAEAAKADAETAADNTDEVDVVEDTSKEINTGLKVSREPFTHNGVERYDYFVEVSIADKTLKAHFESSTQKDIGAFEVFNAFYDLSNGELQFRLVPYTIKAQKKGEEDKSGYSYVVAAAIAPDAARIKVRPKAESDKALISYAVKLIKNGGQLA